MKVAIYNEHCVQAGKEVLGWDGERESDDFHVYEGTPEELLVQARCIEVYNQPFNAYKFRCAESIRQAVYANSPEPEPAE